jgi:glycosyltransferase involved in cell wall biosynthesis
MHALSETVHTRPRVAFLIPNLAVGGAERVIAQLVTSFVDLGQEVDLLMLREEGELLPQIPAGARRINLDVPNAYAALPGLVRYFRRERPRVILTTLELTSLLTILALCIARVPTRHIIRIATTISQHRRSPLKKRLERVLVKWFYPHAEGIVVVSHGAAADFSRYARIPLDRVQVIYNPVITPGMLVDAGKPLTHPFFQPGQPPVVLGVGRLSEPKDFPTLVRAFACLRQRIPAHLLILGEGEERLALEELIRSLGIAGEIDLPGYSENPFAYMSKAAVYVSSSRWEGLPNGLIQALACGCPVVSTDCPSGPVEILDGGKFGTLVPVGDVEGLADAIERVLRGEKQAVPAYWLEQFEAGRVARQYLDVMGLVSHD